MSTSKLGYGKLLSSDFTDLLRGAGTPVFAVWMYAVAHEEDEVLTLNPKILALVIGMTESEASQAIAELCRRNLLMEDGGYHFGAAAVERRV